jgi:tetratricopeptide (TPR) repeat protein
MRAGPERTAKLGVGLAEILFARKSYEASFATLSAALAASPNTSQRLRAATLYRQTGQLPEAVATLEKAVASEPAISETHLQMGEILQQQGKLAEAESQYLRALELDPGSPAAHNSLGSALGSQGKLEEALSHFQRALEIRPEYLEALNNMGLALQRLGRLDDARARFEEALRASPDWPVAQNALARILATHPDPARRDPARAVHLADRAAELTGYENPRILDTLAAAYASAGNFEKAVSVAEEAIRLAQDEALAASIRVRVNLYRERKPFVDAPRN